MQSIGASVEYGNIQGAVFNVITKQGGDRFQYDASYYGQASALTSQPVVAAGVKRQRAYERLRARAVPGLHDEPRRSSRARSAVVLRRVPVPARLRQSTRHGPEFPRTYEQDKIFGKLTWRLTPSLQLMQSFHEEFWVNPTRQHS